eukprot:16449206-Heterocapsa_arctica.AAC.1
MPEPDGHLIAESRRRVWTTIGSTPTQEHVDHQCLSPEVIAAYCSANGDPDSVLAYWLRHGAPLGVELPVTATGVFPRVTYVDPTARVLGFYRFNARWMEKLLLR